MSDEVADDLKENVENFESRLPAAERTALIQTIVELCSENRFLKEHRDLLASKLQEKDEVMDKERREVFTGFVQLEKQSLDKNRELGEYVLSLEKLIQAERNAFSKVVAELLIENQKMKARLDREILLNHEYYFQRPQTGRK
jgi:hypothetical protein